MDALRTQQALLEVKASASPESEDPNAAAALVNAEIMKDSKHCVIMNNAVWNGPTYESAKNELLTSYSKYLVNFLTSVDENHPGYVGNGYIT
eukprot:2296030-Heterocapsa_arctica.AAC.1